MSLAENLNPREHIGANNPPLLVEDEIADALRPYQERINTLAKRASALPAVIKNDDQKGAAGDVAKDARKLCREVEASREAVKKPYLEAGKLVDLSYAAPKERLASMWERIEDRASQYDKGQIAEKRRKAEEDARKLREEEMRRADAAEAAAQAGRKAHAAQHLDKADEAAELAAHAEATARQSSLDLTRHRSVNGTVGSAGTKWKGEIVDVSELDLQKLRPYLTRADLQKALDGFVRNNTSKDTAIAPALAGARIFSDIQTRFR